VGKPEVKILLENQGVVIWAVLNCILEIAWADID
jgi:hypothetical protein